MPFVRVTLVNNTNHIVDAALQLDPPGMAVVSAPPHTTVIQPQPGSVVHKILKTSSVFVSGPGAVFLHPKADIPAAGGDVQEAVLVLFGPGSPNETLSALVGPDGWVHTPLVK